MSDMHKKFLTEVVGFVIDKTKDESLYEMNDPHSAGYRLAIYSVLHMIENEALAWGVPKSDVGLGSFSSDEWLLKGIDYWKEPQKGLSS